MLSDARSLGRPTGGGGPAPRPERDTWIRVVGMVDDGAVPY